MARKVVSGNAGKMPRSFIDTVEFANTEWSYNEIAEEEEVTNSTSAGKNEYDYGNTHIEGSISADWDVQDNPHDTPPALTAGSRHAFMGYIHSSARETNANSVSGEDGPFLRIDIMAVNNVNVTCPSKGKVNYTFDYKSVGSYYLPTGEAATSSSGA